jgi:hypothetical protein
MDAKILRIDQHSLPARRHLPATRVSFEITRGRARERLRPVSGKVFLIGTASDCDLVLGDLSFPESYAYVFVAGEKVTIRWLGGPELLLGGEPIQSAELFHGDLVEFGPFQLRVLIEPSPARDRDLDRENVFAFPTPQDMTERLEALDEVRSLLVDIRREIGALKSAG